MRLIVSILFGLVQQKLTNALLAFEVRIAGLYQLIHGQVLILEDAFFYRRNGVCKVRCARHIHAGCRIFCAAVLDGFTAFHTAPGYHGCEDDRIPVHVDALHQIVAGSDHIIMVDNLLFKSILQFLYIFKLSRISGFEPDTLARGGIHAIVQNEFDHFSHIDVSDVR